MPQIGGPQGSAFPLPGGEEAAIVRTLLNKVPEITIYFWIIKIMATTIGETAADLLSETMHLGLVITSYIMSGILIVALVFQFRTRKYVPGFYWFAVALLAVVGTLISDFFADQMHVPLQVNITAFSILLAATFATWYGYERTLSIHTIFTRRREAFYWAAILFTFALGTSGGDFLSEKLNWGYLNSALIFAAGILVITIGYYRFKWNPVASFWIAYILTRPLGGSIGDFLTQPHSAGGLGLGTIGTSAIFLSTIFGLVVYLTKSGVDQTSSVDAREMLNPTEDDKGLDVVGAP